MHIMCLLNEAETHVKKGFRKRKGPFFITVCHFLHNHTVTHHEAEACGNPDQNRKPDVRARTGNADMELLASLSGVWRALRRLSLCSLTSKSSRSSEEFTKGGAIKNN